MLPPTYRNAPEPTKREFWATLGREVGAEHELCQRIEAQHGVSPRGFRPRTQWSTRWESKARVQHLRQEGRLKESNFEAERDMLLNIAPTEYFARLCDREPGYNGKVICPVHDEKTPSCHVWPDPERGWHCWGCGAGGDIYDLACAAWGLAKSGREFGEAHRRLLEVFG